jgi:hypothetical protein
LQEEGGPVEEESKAVTDDVPEKIPVKNKRAFKIDEHNTHFTVRNPMMSNGHIVYQMAGKDKQGKFEGQRRFNEFYQLHQTISQRWPGVFVPKIPPKKSFVRFFNLRTTQIRSLLTKGDFTWKSSCVNLREKTTSSIQKNSDVSQGRQETSKLQCPDCRK